MSAVVLPATGHSVVAPSAGARRIQCSASVLMEQQFPESEDDRQDAAEGEASHWAGAELLAGRLPDEGDRAPNGVVLTVEMLEGADLYADDVTRALAKYGLKPADGAIEQRVEIHAVHPLCFGTPDFRAWVPAHVRPERRPLLKLWDYKFGHRYVEVHENVQCIEYVSGCLGATNLPDWEVDVEITIVQPRSYHPSGPVRRWAFRGDQTRAHINRSSNAAHEALGPNPKAHVGPECRDCRARHACQTLQRAAADACDVAGTAQPFGLSTAALGVELRMLKRAEELLKARIAGLEQQALAAIRSGVSVPHWGVERSSGRREWSKPAAEVFALGAMFGLDLQKPAEPITPLQAVQRGIPEALLGTFSETKPGAVKLVPDTGSKARQIFGGESAT